MLIGMDYYLSRILVIRMSPSKYMLLEGYRYLYYCCLTVLEFKFAEAKAFGEFDRFLIFSAVSEFWREDRFS